MKLPRFTVRRQMDVEAIVAFIMWGEIRRARFEGINRHLEAKWRELASSCHEDIIPGSGRDATLVAKIEYILLMRRKYTYAARYPWLPVEPDPPEPR
jgi:hypothetical protein